MCSLYKGVKRGGESVPSSIYKEYNKTMGKGVKSCGKVCSSIYRVYNKRVYKGKKGAERKWWER